MSLERRAASNLGAVLDVDGCWEAISNQHSEIQQSPFQSGAFRVGTWSPSDRTAKFLTFP